MKTVAIFGVPRSGTSWLGQILNSSPQVAYRYQPLFAYSFEGFIDEYSSSKDIETFHQTLFKCTDDFVCQTKNISGNDTPDFEKSEITHLVWKEVRYLNIIENLLNCSDCKIIGIVRHPCGVLNSWFNTPREFDPEWSVIEEWRKGRKKNRNKYDFYGYEKWLEACRLFLHFRENFNNRFITVNYEQLIQQPEKETQKIFDFINLPYEKQTLRFLKTSTSLASSDDPYGVYRENKSGFEWIEELDQQIVESILSDERFKKVKNNFQWNIWELKNR